MKQRAGYTGLLLLIGLLGCTNTEEKIAQGRTWITLIGQVIRHYQK